VWAPAEIFRCQQFFLGWSSLGLL